MKQRSESERAEKQRDRRAWRVQSVECGMWIVKWCVGEAEILNADTYSDVLH